LQAKITELTQTQTENTRLLNELNQTNADLENELTQERTDRRQAETARDNLQTQLNEAQAKLADQRTALTQLLTNRELDPSTAPEASFCL
jgi:chromosome segregation ATPase